MIIDQIWSFMLHGGEKLLLASTGILVKCMLVVDLGQGGGGGVGIWRVHNSGNCLICF